MADPVVDHAPTGALPKTTTLNEQVKMRQSAADIIGAFTKSGTIPTGGGRKKVQKRAPAPRVLGEDVTAADEDDGAPMTLADLRKQVGGRAATPRPLEEDDGGFDASALVPKRKPKGGASLAAGALRAMRKKK
jgi:hypothetical protein